MKDEVIVIEEENHGLIGIAESYKAAVDCAINWGWGELDEMTIYDEIERPLTEEEKKSIYTWGIDKFNEMFDGQFHMYYMDLWKEGE